MSKLKGRCLRKEMEGINIMFLYCIAFQYSTEMEGINIMFEYWAGRPCCEDVSLTLPLDTTLLARTAFSALHKFFPFLYFWVSASLVGFCFVPWLYRKHLTRMRPLKMWRNLIIKGQWELAKTSKTSKTFWKCHFGKFSISSPIIAYKPHVGNVLASWASNLTVTL